MSETPIPFPQKGLSAANAGERRYKAGEIVWLKSGSPALTVNDLGSPPTVTVDWFDFDHCACRDAFHQDQLTTTPKTYPSSVEPSGFFGTLMGRTATITKPAEEKPGG